VRHRLCRVELECALVMAARIGELIFLQQQDAEIRVGGRVAGMQRDDALEELARCATRTLPVQHAAESAEGFGVRRCSRKHVAIGRFRVVERVGSFELKASLQK